MKYRISKIVLALAKERGIDPTNTTVLRVLLKCSVAERDRRSGLWVCDQCQRSLPLLLGIPPWQGPDFIADSLIAAAVRLGVPLEDAP